MTFVLCVRLLPLSMEKIEAVLWRRAALPRLYAAAQLTANTGVIAMAVCHHCLVVAQRGKANSTPN